MAREDIPTADMTLGQITAKVKENFEAHTRTRIEYALKQGELLSAAWKLCESADCGIAGDNPKARYGAWVSANFPDTYQTTSTFLNYRKLHEGFGHLGATGVVKIGLSNCYFLNNESPENTQLVIEAAAKLRKGKKLSFADVQDLLCSPEPEPTPEEEEQRRRERTERFDAKYGQYDSGFEQRIIDFTKGSASIFTKEEYRLIAACLHPAGELSEAKKTTAFQVFTNMKERLVTSFQSLQI